MRKSLIKICFGTMVFCIFIFINTKVNALVIEGAGVGGPTKTNTNNTTSTSTYNSVDASHAAQQSGAAGGYSSSQSATIQSSTPTYNSVDASHVAQQSGAAGGYSRYTGWSGDGSKYYRNGEAIKNRITTINGTLYKFDSNGNATIYNSVDASHEAQQRGATGGYSRYTGWNGDNTKYYMNGDILADVNIEIEDTFYRIDSNGIAQKYNGIWENEYYKNGKQIKNKKTYNINGVYYDIDKTGKITKLNNVIRDNKYYNKNGKLVKSKKTYNINNTYYDIDKNGKLTKLNKVIRDNKYYNKNGKLVTN